MTITLVKDRPENHAHILSPQTQRQELNKGNIMKTYIALSVSIIALAATGCSTTRTASNATVCPDCRTVMVEVPDVYSDNPGATREVGQHDCPGCKGRLASLFSDGTLKHQCSICTEEGYSCPIIHPTTQN